MTKEKQAEIVLSDEDLTELYAEETLLKSHLLHTTKVSADKAEAVKSAKLKSSCLAVVLSAFLGLFGAGSFYLGYWKRGICKILFNVVLPVALGMVFLFWLAPTYNAYRTAADETSDMVAYKTLNAYYGGYSDAYNDVMTLFGRIDGNNDTLKSVYEYVTEEKDLQDHLQDTTKTFESVFTSEFLQSVKSLRALGEIVSEEDYKFIEESLISSELIEKLDILTDTAQIDDVVYTVENLSDILSAEKTDNVAEDLNVLSEKLDGLTALRDTDDLFSAAAAINQTPVTDRLTENVRSMTEVIAVLENLQSFIDDVVLKYQTLTGRVYGQTAGEEEDNSLSHAVAELIATLDSKDNEELIAKLTALKNNLDGFAVSDIVVVENTLTDFLKSDECETAYVFTSKFGGELKSALVSLNALAGTVDENGEKVNLYSEFANTESIYKMTHQASLICEFAAEYQTLAADYDLFGGLKELDAKLNFANVSGDYIASLRAACSLIEVNEKLYDYSNGETIYFDSNVSNVEKVMESLSKANAIAESYAANASNLSSEWDSNCRILTMLFTIVLAIDGAIIVAYWIGEVFKDRAKCLIDNDKKIKNLLQ